MKKFLYYQTRKYILKQYINTFSNWGATCKLCGAKVLQSNLSKNPKAKNLKPRKHNAKSTPKPAAKPSTTNPAAKPTPKPAAKPTPKPAAKPTPKPAAKPTPKPAAKQYSTESEDTSTDSSLSYKRPVASKFSPKLVPKSTPKPSTKPLPKLIKSRPVVGIADKKNVIK